MDNNSHGEQLLLHNITLAIPTCEDDMLRLDWVGYSLAALNALSVIVNVIHILILSRIASLKGSGYYHILLHIAASDIYFSLIIICKMVWNDPSYFSNSSRAEFLVYYVVMDTAVYGRYCIMTVASLERYYAMCRSLRYSVSNFTRRIHLWLPLVWFISFLMAAIRTSVSHKYICFNSLSGPLLLGGGTAASKLVGIFIPSLTTAILLTRVIVELFRMRNRSATQEEKQVKRATHYLISVIVLFYLHILPSTISFSAFASSVDDYGFSLGFYWSQFLPFTAC